MRFPHPQDRPLTNNPLDEVRLTTETLDVLAGRGADVPGYDRAVLAPRIVHIGVGGFHRSHLAVYCDDLAARGSDWGTCGVGLLDTDRTIAHTLCSTVELNKACVVDDELTPIFAALDDRSGATS